MAFSNEQLVAIRDKVHANVPKILEANTLKGKGTGQWDFCVVHSDGKALGSYSILTPACHIHCTDLVGHYSRRSQCLQQGLSVPVAIIQSIPALKYFKDEDELRYYVNYVLNESIYKDMFLLKDVQGTLDNGFVVRTDVHADWVLRTLSFLRKVEEYNGTSKAVIGNAGEEIPPNVAMLLGSLMQSTSLEPLTSGHGFLGVYANFKFSTIQEFIEQYIQDVQDGITDSLQETEGWYMRTKKETHGWTMGRFVDKYDKFFGTREQSTIPAKYIPEINTGLRVRTHVTNANCAQVALNIYKGEFK